MKKILQWIYISLIAIPILAITFFHGCMGSADTEFYRNPSFKNYKIKIIAILPIRNDKLSNAESIEVNSYYLKGLMKKLSTYTIMTPEIAVQLLDKDSVSDKYYKFLSDYPASGKGNTELVKQIGSILHCDAIFQCLIYNISSQYGIYTRRFGKTSCKVRYSMISTQDGTVLWKAESDAYQRNAATDEPAPPLYEAVENGMDDIIDEMAEMR